MSAFSARRAFATPLLLAALCAPLAAQSQSVIQSRDSDGTLWFQAIPAIVSAGTSAEWLIVELDQCDSDMMTAVADSYAYLIGHGLAKGK